MAHNEQMILSLNVAMSETNLVNFFWLISPMLSLGNKLETT